MNAERREQRRLTKGMPAMVVGIILPPLILALARACPGPPVLDRTGNPWVTYEAKDGARYLHARKKESWWTAQRLCAERGAILLPPPASTSLASSRSAFQSMVEELSGSMPPHVSPALWVDLHRDANGTWLGSQGEKVDDKVWALLPVNISRKEERCGFLFVFPEDRLSPQPSITLYGLLDGSCVDRREFLCQANQTA